jgi:hypothetical protein
MRNVFDQYEQPENRLSHALAVCLDEDRTLLRDFLKRVRLQSPKNARKLLIVEQSLPNDPPRVDSEEEAEKPGLPDIVIHDDEAWCLLIESKVRASLTEDQLRRHNRTLHRRGFEQIRSLALTKANVRVPKGTIPFKWSELYEWLGANGGKREWAKRLRSYLRDAEVRLANTLYLGNTPYLTEGTLTMFDGFRFSSKNRYTYGEGKRLLKLAMTELRKDRSLKALGMDPKARGRGAITGRSGDFVWDYLSLLDRPKRGTFTSYPHLTLGIHDDHLEVAITIPNSVARQIRKRFLNLGAEGLIKLNSAVLSRARKILAQGGQVQAYAVQRHYPSQRSSGVVDARMHFRLEIAERTPRGGVRRQPEWVEFFAEILRRKRSNIQFGYVINLPWGIKGINSRKSLRLIAESWGALKPLLDAIRGHH